MQENNKKRDFWSRNYTKLLSCHLDWTASVNLHKETKPWNCERKFNGRKTCDKESCTNNRNNHRLKGYPSQCHTILYMIHFLIEITEINKLLTDILINWDAPVSLLYLSLCNFISTHLTASLLEIIFEKPFKDDGSIVQSYVIKHCRDISYNFISLVYFLLCVKYKILFNLSIQISSFFSVTSPLLLFDFLNFDIFKI